MKQIDKIKDIERRIEECVTQMKELDEELVALKLGHWSFGEDTRRLEDVEISCNEESWTEAKRVKVSKPFYIGDLDDSSSNCVDFCVADAKNIIKYLQEKVDFLES